MMLGKSLYVVEGTFLPSVVYVIASDFNEASEKAIDYWVKRFIGRKIQDGRLLAIRIVDPLIY